MKNKIKFDTFGGVQTPPFRAGKEYAALSIDPEQNSALRPRCRRIDLKSLKFDKQGLIPAIIQDYKSGEVLMLAYMNKESVRRTLKSGKTCFWSRSRKKYWVKGETSGNYQFVKGIAYDCDMDALLIKVRQVGVACHTGSRSCFYRKIK